MKRARKDFRLMPSWASVCERVTEAMNHSISSFALIVLVWLSACSGSGGASSTPTNTAVVIMGQAPDAPAGCGVQEVVQRLLDFAEAFNRQDPQLGNSFFSERAPFAWYSAPGGDQTTIYSPKELATYFEHRYAQHERLNFKRIQVNGWEAGRGLVHFEFAVNRQANDIYAGAAQEVIGKGAFHCVTQTFVVISIGDA